MRAACLTENTSSRADLTAEHGLSLFLETRDHRILFDAGQTGAFADNARKMGIDLAQADLAVLSHGHYDHGGGLKTFLEINDHAPVYVHPRAFDPHRNGPHKDIGLDPGLAESPRLVFAGEDRVIGDGLSLHGAAGREPLTAIDSFGLSMVENGQLVPDDFSHEQYLLIREGDKTILFSGCSHRGIVNIASWFRPDILVGGFHFKKLDPQVPQDRQRLEEAARALLALPTRYYTCHCTGEEPYRFLKERMGDRLFRLSAGDIVTL